MRHFWATGLAVLASLAAVGCESEPPSELEQLIAESPFRSGGQGELDELVLVSCRYYPMQVSGQAEVVEWSFWEEYAAGRGGPEEGFEASSVQLWEANGFAVARAPLSAWKGLREEIVKAGGDVGELGQMLFRRPGEATTFGANWVSEARPVAVWGPGGMRVVSLEAGEAVFEVAAEPRGEKGGEGVWMSIEPRVLGAEGRSRVVRRPTGGWERLEERWSAEFGGLRLAGNIGREEFVAVGLRTGTEEVETLGSVFLRGREGSVQLVAVFVPEVTTARQLQEGW